MKSYRAVIFDLDGTLVDNRASFELAYARYCASYPQYLDPSCCEQREGLIGIYYAADRSAAYEAFCSRWGWEQRPLFDVFWKEWLTLYANSAVPFPDVKETLEMLVRKGVRAAVITNGEGTPQRAKLTSAGLISYFSPILISEEVGIAKPAPQIYWLCVDLLGLSAADCLFVGDTPSSDIDGALAAGMDSLLVGESKSCTYATYTAKDVSFLKALLA